MDENVRNDIISVLNDAADILTAEQERDAADLIELSNHTIHNASIFQDEDSISVAIFIYALSKVIERREGQLNYGFIRKMIIAARDDIKSERADLFRNSMKKAFDFISSLDSKLKLYVEEVIKQAEIRKGSKLYAHGISLARTAEILGVSQWELMAYVGNTRLTDSAGGLSVKQRILYARSLFR
ncbi:MAG TPA: hypothetical protein VFF28_01140 [Candidatus Nanoarchaeia archaeon]|nr:hypothetical protein [Candidatus Nanoarchaeia archaeon]